MMYKFVFNFYPVERREVTTVQIFNSIGLFAEGASICMPNDKYDAEVGNRKAIARALADFNPPLKKDARLEVWAEYNTNTS